ncbi:zf-TFIIB domain-containing protein [Cyanobacterium sp. uoEpiScrs1]|uniref:zf-TFIIB domain-containing protein n=1 Tax=Cyanobacterium sp. uoEpiScrs1 TaxID=2976343 RepID=UPI00226AD7FC|nr:zf-TFIIB domain-containing protein [Cyanobacterium sp. uoEpiScrs1]
MNISICPKCGGNLEKIIYEETEVDRCCQCLGIWLDSLEAEQLKNIKGSEIIDSGNFQEENPSESLQKKVNCPRCQISMIKILDFDEYPLWYETCLKCHGLWFDAGEFQQFKQNFQHTGYLARAIKILRLRKNTLS